ncbi:MAG: hypothetical protein HUJ26_01015 [Planctomycetaceae bacterium]|nr:hypothetical protein [Planctomycetaceae bacterium]
MRNTLTKLALVLTATALVVSVRVLEHESPVDRTSDKPTSANVLARLDELGGTYKLNDLGQVNWLNLKCLPISDDDLQILDELPHLGLLNLRGINVHKGYRFSNAGLKHVGSLKKLVNLNLSANGSITNAGIEHLAGCSRLRKLNLASTNTDSGCLTSLTKIPRLDYLTLSYDPLNEETLPYFQQMKLKVVKGLKVADEDLHLFAELPTLQSLPLASYRKIRDTDLKHLKPHLKYRTQLEIVLTKGWSDTSELKHLADLPRLDDVSLQDYKYPQPYIPNNGPLDLTGFEVLATLPNLKRLSVPTEDRFLAARAMCPTIEKISLGPNEFLSSEGLEVITTMPHLKEIWVHEKLVSEELLEIISRVKPLEKLTLERSYPIKKTGSGYRAVPVRPEGFTVEGLKHLTKLPHLKILWMSNWGIDDEMLGVLGRITTLEVLVLGTSSVTDIGMMQLRHLWNLRHLGMYGSNVSQQVCYQLHRYMPRCTIEDMWCCGCLAITPGVESPSYLW